MVHEMVRPGDVVWDIGANVGLFAFAAANRAGSSGQVIAVEPDLWLSESSPPLSGPDRCRGRKSYSHPGRSL